MHKILFVDDSDDNLNLYKIYLKKEDDLDVTYTNSGVNALELLKNEIFDVAFIDVQMPEVDGFDIMNFIETNEINVITVALTGFNDQDTLGKISTFSFREVLIKPILKKDLVEKIKSYIK